MHQNLLFLIVTATAASSFSLAAAPVGVPDSWADSLLAPAAPFPEPRTDLAQLVAAFDGRLGVSRAPHELDTLGELDPAFARPVARLLAAVLWAAEVRDGSFEGISDEALLAFSGSESDRRALDLVSAVDRQSLEHAAAVLAATVDAVVPQLQAYADSLSTTDLPAAAPLVNLPPVLVADPLGVPSTYQDDAILAIDVGGADVYDMNAGGSIIGIGPSADPASCQVDLGLVAVGCEFNDAAVSLTASLLVDISGNDSYGVRKTPQFSDAACQASTPIIRRIVMQGGGSGGIGMLVDVAGDDTYDAKTLSQGHGHLSGVGVLADLAGNDVYKAIRSSQGSGVLGGSGYFFDGAGSDTHVFASPAGGIFNVDASACDATARLGLGSGVLSATGHFIAHGGVDSYSIQSQAFGFGSLGVGTFIDDAGTDNYNGYAGRSNNQNVPSTGGLFVDQGLAG